MPILYVVDVKHGNSAVLIDKNGVVIFDAGRRIELMEFLLSKSITTIDNIILSHADADHIGGVMALINSQKFSIKAVYVNSDIKDTKIFDDLVYSVYSDKNIHFEVSITPNLNGLLNKGEVYIEVVAPSTYLAAKGAGSKDRKGRIISSNSISAVIRLIYKNKNIALFPGDIDVNGLNNLLDDGKDIDAKILIFPHHGGSPGGMKVTGFVEDICGKTNADFIIFSIDDNDHDYPRIDVLNCIISKFNNSKMFATGASKILEDYINKNPHCAHKNGMGNIEIDFDKDPLTCTQC